jgi:hypothetical protein
MLGDPKGNTDLRLDDPSFDEVLKIVNPKDR